MNFDKSTTYETKPQGLERTRETNPIYQGPYTITDYLRESKNRDFTTDAGLQFIQKFHAVPPIERERLEYIDTQAKAQYHGPESWEAGNLWDIPQYLVGNISGLDYFRIFYELSDREAIEKRLQQIEDMASYLEIKDKTYHELDRILKERPDFLEAVNERTALYSEIFLEPTGEDQEIKKAIILLSDYATNRGAKKEDYEDLISETYKEIREETEALRRIMELGDMESMRGTEYRPLVEFMESELSEETFSQSFGQFRATHEGEGIQGARLRILRTVLYGFVFYPIFRGDLLESEGGIGILKDVIKNTLQNAIYVYSGPEATRHPEDPVRSLMESYSTREMAHNNPFSTPNKFVNSHGILNASIGTAKAIKQIHFNDFSIPWRREKNGKPALSNRFKITNINGTPTQDDVSLLSTIATIQADKNVEAYKNMSLNAPIKISENSLLQYHYGADTEYSNEQREQLYDWLIKQSGQFVEIDFNETLDEIPGLRETLSHNFPKDQVHAGIIGGPQLQFTYVKTKNARPDKEGNTTFTRWYIFEKFPLTIYYDMVLRQSSLLDSSLRETPSLEEGAGLSPSAISKMEELEKDGLNLWTINKGRRTLSLKKDPRIPAMKNVILSQIEINTKREATLKSGYFRLNIDEIHTQVWGSGTYSKSTVIEQKKRIIKYLIYLMSNPKSKIETFKLNKKKRGQEQTVDVYLRREALSNGKD